MAIDTQGGPNSGTAGGHGHAVVGATIATSGAAIVSTDPA
jgi:hypothetical protein